MRFSTFLASQLLIAGITIAGINEVVSKPITDRPPLKTCGPHEAVKNIITKKYKEKLLFLGVEGITYVLQVYFNEKRSSYTIVRTDTKGKSCVMSAGFLGSFTYGSQL